MASTTISLSLPTFSSSSSSSTNCYTQTKPSIFSCHQLTGNLFLYGELLKIGGGKERLARKSSKELFMASFHKRKTELFMALFESRLLPLRPGVAKLIDQALEKVAV